MDFKKCIFFLPLIFVGISSQVATAKETTAQSTQKYYSDAEEAELKTWLSPTIDSFSGLTGYVVDAITKGKLFKEFQNILFRSISESALITEIRSINGKPTIVVDFALNGEKQNTNSDSVLKKKLQANVYTELCDLYSRYFQVELSLSDITIGTNLVQTVEGLCQFFLSKIKDKAYLEVTNCGKALTVDVFKSVYKPAAKEEFERLKALIKKVISKLENDISKID